VSRESPAARVCFSALVASEQQRPLSAACKRPELIRPSIFTGCAIPTPAARPARRAARGGRGAIGTRRHPNGRESLRPPVAALHRRHRPRDIRRARHPRAFERGADARRMVIIALAAVRVCSPMPGLLQPGPPRPSIAEGAGRGAHPTWSHKATGCCCARRPDRLIADESTLAPIRERSECAAAIRRPRA